MNREQIDKILMKYSDKSSLTKEEEFELIESLEYMIAHKELAYKGEYTSFCEWLGGIYYDKKMFELALKYYELAEMCGSRWAWVGLGYIWYYGRTGNRDYEKAFNYFNKMATYGGDEVDRANKIEARFKIADMYKNGYFVEKDYEKYKEIVEQLYEESKCGDKDYMYFRAEIYMRIAKIREKQGNIDEALNLYWIARDDLKNRLYTNRFFGTLNMINWVVNDIYRLMDFDVTEMDLYDLYYLLKNEHLVTFLYKNKEYEIESKLSDDGDMNIRFNDKWYRSIDDFFIKTDLNGESIEHEYNLLENWRIVR